MVTPTPQTPSNRDRSRRSRESKIVLHGTERRAPEDLFGEALPITEGERGDCAYHGHDTEESASVVSKP